MKAKKAIVLAAGLGTRLRPLTASTPKPLLPIWGESMLERIVNQLRELGVEEIAVNAHAHSEQIVEWCEKNNCRAVVEKEILGTGGVLNNLRSWIGDENFYLVNGDIVIENLPDIDAVNSSNYRDAEIGVALTTLEGPRTIEVESESNFVTCWKSEDAGWNGTFTYCGFACLTPQILKYVEPSGFSSIIEAYERAMNDGKFIRAITSEELLWADAGTIDSYISLNTSENENALSYLPQLRAVGLENANVTFLGARGSNRAFFKCDDKIAVVYDDEARGENAKYAAHARWLKEQGVNVPEVLSDSKEMKTTVFEFVGSSDLKERFSKTSAIDLYAPIVEALAKFNALDARALELEAPFDCALYQWERDLFSTHCLHDKFSRSLSDNARAELAKVEEVLMKEPLQLVHRDFQSTNILFKNDKFYFIDFQGMRLGPAVYDLASLLYDPYVNLTERERYALAALYGKTVNRMEITEVLPFAAVQRLVQALGAFCRLESVGQTTFAQYITPALKNLLSAADLANLDAIGALAEDLLAAHQS